MSNPYFGSLPRRPLSTDFDPYKVDRWQWTDEGSLDRCLVVEAADYDKLLALYKAAINA